MADNDVETLPVSLRPEGIGHTHHTIEIDQGNNVVLLDIGIDGEKRDAGSLKLAEDNHVSSASGKLELDIFRC